MEGSYDKAWQATRAGEVPAEEYKVFSPILVETIRKEIADCCEKAYSSLPLRNAQTLLFLENEQALASFIDARGWKVEQGRINFRHGAASSTENEWTQDGISNTLLYAKELETIV